LSELLVEKSDARQALLFLASIGRLNLTIDGENAIVRDICPAEKDDSVYSWLLSDLRAEAGESGVVCNESLTRLMNRSSQRITNDAKGRLGNLHLTRRDTIYGMIWSMCAVPVLPFIGFLIEPAFATRNWGFPLFWGMGVIMITGGSVAYFILRNWIRVRRYWLLTVFITLVAHGVVTGGLYSMRPCTWDMISAIVWAGIGGGLGIVLGLSSRSLTLKGIREAARGLKYLRKLKKTGVEIGPEFQRWLAYQGDWDLPSDGGEPRSFWTNWLRSSATEPRARGERNRESASAVTMALIEDMR
jgi:hypothetical protein